MGWASGSELLEGIIRTLREHVPDKRAREAIYDDLIPIFEDHDCDTLDECVGIGDPAFDAAWAKIYDGREDEDYEGDN